MDPVIWRLLLYFLITVIVTGVIIKLTRWILSKIFQRLNRGDKQGFDPTSYSFISNAISFSFILIALLIFIFGIPQLRVYGEKIFVGAGLLTIAVGFASQSAIANIIGGIFIVLFRPFRVNDVVHINQNLGVVEDITLRHTVIKNFENRRIIIPNSIISNETIINSTINDGRICNFIELSIAFEADMDKAFRIIREEAMAHPLYIDNRKPEDIEENVPSVRIRVLGWLDSGVQVRAMIWTENLADGVELKSNLYKRFLERFREAEIEIPYPHRTIVEKKYPSADATA
jgi:small-conductance mechanosensitive channel